MCVLTDTILTLSVENTGLDMAPFIRNVSFHSINMLGVLEDNISLASQIFAEVMGLLERGIAKPVQPIVPMPLSDLEHAIRLMQTGKHIGKVVLELSGNDIVPVSLLRPHN